MKQNILKKVMIYSSWSFTLVLCSMFFGTIGNVFDKWLNTPPMFMVGFISLGFFLMVMKLYMEAVNDMKR